MIDLGTLGGSRSGGANINNRGQVVGTASVGGDLQDHAFLYSDGRMYDLNALVTSGLNGATLTGAVAINDNGQIVAMGCRFVPFCAGSQTYLLDPVPLETIPTLSTWVLGLLALLIVITAASQVKRTST